MQLELEEIDTNYEEDKHKFGHNSSDVFAKQKLLSLRLKSESQRHHPRLLKLFDENLLAVIKDEEVEKLVRCLLCGDVQSYFVAGEGFQPLNKVDLCTQQLHYWDKRLFDVQAEEIKQTKQSKTNPSNRWKFACIINIFEYLASSGFQPLKSTKQDFMDIAAALINAGYDMTPMGWKEKKSLEYLEKMVTKRGFINPRVYWRY